MSDSLRAESYDDPDVDPRPAAATLQQHSAASDASIIYYVYGAIARSTVPPTKCEHRKN